MGNSGDNSPNINVVSQESSTIEQSVESNSVPLLTPTTPINGISMNPPPDTNMNTLLSHLLMNNPVLMQSDEADAVRSPAANNVPSAFHPITTDEIRTGLWNLLRSFGITEIYDKVLNFITISDSREHLSLKLLTIFFTNEMLADTWYGEETPSHAKKYLDENKINCIKDICFLGFPCNQELQKKAWNLCMKGIINRCRTVRNRNKNKKKQEEK